MLMRRCSVATHKSEEERTEPGASVVNAVHSRSSPSEHDCDDGVVFLTVHPPDVVMVLATWERWSDSDQQPAAAHAS